MKKIFIFIKITNENLHGLNYHNNLREWSISPGSISPHLVASMWRIKNYSRDKHQIIYI